MIAVLFVRFSVVCLAFISLVDYFVIQFPFNVKNLPVSSMQIANLVIYCVQTFYEYLIWIIYIMLHFSVETLPAIFIDAVL